MMPKAVSSTPQWADLFRLVHRSRRYLPLLALAAIIVALFSAGYYNAASQPRYTSEAIALVRPPVSFVLSTPETTAFTQIGEDQRRGQPSYLPAPLDAFDYRVLLESDAVFDRAAALYNERFAPHTPMTAAAFRRACVAVERLEVRTPHAAKYHPTLSLRATAGDPERALRMAQCWVDAAERWAHSYEQSVRSRQVGALQQVRMELLTREGDEETGAAHLRQIDQALLDARVAAARSVFEFEIVAEPILPAPQAASSVATPALLTGVVAFIGLYALTLVVLLFGQAARVLGIED